MTFMDLTTKKQPQHQSNNTHGDDFKPTLTLQS